VVCIFQLPATITGRIGPNHASASRSIRSSARWTASDASTALGQLAERGLRRLAPGSAPRP
jgi:hypothetical protein